MQERKTVDIIIVSEQLQQIDFIEKSLKTAQVINSHQSNQLADIKRILSYESIELIIVDDATQTVGVGSIKSLLNELHLSIPILQLQSSGNDQKVGQFMQNGADAVCPNNDAAAIVAYGQLLLIYHDGLTLMETGEGAAKGFQQKFDDLYQGISDPICYLQDGLFVDCNPAFLRMFEIADKSELDALTIMNFINRKGQSDLKTHLKKSTRRDLSSSPITLQMQSLSGTPLEFMLMSKPTTFNNENVVQVYLRSTSEGGAGAGLFDETTGLANKEQMDFFIKQKIEAFNNDNGEGTLAYLMIKNYRDIWGSDGFNEAEKFISATANFIRKQMPAHTEISRYTDDGVLMFIPTAESKTVEQTLTTLVNGLDAVTPEGMARMIEPICYISFDKLHKDSDYLLVISQVFRAARNAALSEGTRVSRPTTTEVAEKDIKRLDILQQAIDHKTMQLRYQPIASFEPDGLERYRERLLLNDEAGAALELDIMINLAERYQLTHHIDKWKMNTLFNKLLEAGNKERQMVQVFITISADSLRNQGFMTWLAEQMQHTGLGGRYFVFEMTTDVVQNAYTGAKHFAKLMHQNQAKIAISKVGSLSKDNARVINDIQPDFIKLDLREIDTLDDNEEAEVMGDICEIASNYQSVIIAEYLESPAQLSRIWPYDVKFIQGDGMTPILDDMDFNFAEFDIS